VLGAGENQQFATSHRKLVTRILSLWVLTPAATAAGAFVLELALSPLIAA
jgi:PiT family inorganic phosphate transporter